MKNKVDFKNAPLVGVVWDDIHLFSGWSSPKKLDKARPARCKTVGFLVKRTSKFIVLVHSLADDYDSDFTIIPTGCVVRIRKAKLDE